MPDLDVVVAAGIPLFLLTKLLKMRCLDLDAVVAWDTAFLLTKLLKSRCLDVVCLTLPMAAD
eukprot:694117-Karenia_brevis.AAC.1